MKKISFKLGSAEIDRVIKELKEYEEDINKKIELFVDSLLSVGIKVASLRVASTKGDSKLPDVVYDINPQGEIVKAAIAIVGKDVLFVEFGAGIAYNTGKQHPKASEFGYGPGTYPSKHPPNRAINPGFWYYSDKDSVGDTVRTMSIGTEATMPIYGAAESMRNEMIRKAVEIFRS